MGNFSDEELKKWLAEEYNKEIDEMEKIMFPDGNIPDDGETEEEARAAYARLVERLKADGIYEEENDSENADDHKEINEKTEEAEKVKIVYLPAKPKKRNRITRVAAAVLVCAAGVFAASMTSQANRKYFIETVEYWRGNDTKIDIDNVKEGDESSKVEDEVLDLVENELNVQIPILMYRPSQFEFYDYQINTIAQKANLEYSYKNTIVTLYIDNKEKISQGGSLSLHGKQIYTFYSKADDIEFSILKIKDEKDKEASYAAQWIFNNTFYQISGKIEKEQLIRIVENIVY
ncbi:MAG: DUF4367 domain-containing protein [Clostridia bacterium]